MEEGKEENKKAESSECPALVYSLIYLSALSWPLVTSRTPCWTRIRDEADESPAVMHRALGHMQASYT